MTTKRFNAVEYWNRRYREGGNSGAGSMDEAAREKADFVNEIIHEFRPQTIIDWGCGDGEVLRRLDIKCRYYGVEVSPYMVLELSKRFSRDFYRFGSPKKARNLRWRGELSMSLDVMFHLVNPIDYRGYLSSLFGTSDRLVLIKSPDKTRNGMNRHVLYRRWTPDVTRLFPSWTLIRNVDDWYLYGFKELVDLLEYS